MTDPVVDWSVLTRIDSLEDIEEEDECETQLVRDLYKKAENFILQFKWCKAIKQAYLGYGIGKIMGVFLFEIEPSSDSVDSILWVVVGDLPSAHLVPDQAPTPAAAIEVYIELFSQWVDAVENGRPLAGIIPARVAPTAEHAKMLRNRLDSLRRFILPIM